MLFKISPLRLTFIPLEFLINGFLTLEVVQDSPTLLREMMRDCKKNMTSNNGIFSEVKILVISHDIPERLYQNWMYKTLEKK
jgi:hypothetical protein